MNASESKINHNPAEAAFHAFLRSVGLLRQVMDPYFARFGISGPQWAVLRVLHRAEKNNEGALRLKDIGQRLFIQPPSVAGVVDRMERLGLLKRSDSKADLRVRRVAMTPQGRALLDHILVGHSGQIHKLFAAFSAQELQDLGNLFKRWETHLTKLAQPQGAFEAGQGDEHQN